MYDSKLFDLMLENAFNADKNIAEGYFFIGGVYNKSADNCWIRLKVEFA